MDGAATEKHLKQNKEIIRVNQLQSNRIAALEGEITKLLSENIQLRTQVIQLNHRQDVSAQKALLDRKLREIHRIVKSLGSNGTVLPGSPAPAPLPIIRKSPRKANLLNLSPEHSPDRSTVDFVSTRRHRSLKTGPSRIASVPHHDDDVDADDNGNGERGNAETELDSIAADPQHAEPESSAPPMARDVASSDTREHARRGSREREREREREVRRSSRRVSRSNDEMTPLHDMSTQHESEEASRASTPPIEAAPEASSRVVRRRSRSSMSFDAAPLPLLEDPSPTTTTAITPQQRSSTSSSSSQRPITTAPDEEKENAPNQRRSTAAIKYLHSSPVKTRTALNVIVDPLPSPNVVQQPPPPSKPLLELQEVKSEPSSPSLDPTTTSHIHAHAHSPSSSSSTRSRSPYTASSSSSSSHTPSTPSEPIDPPQQETEGVESGRSRRGAGKSVVSYAEPSLRVKMRRTEAVPGDKRRKSTYRRTSSSGTVGSGGGSGSGSREGLTRDAIVIEVD